MQKYRILVHGRNLLREVDGFRVRYGFYTNVFVEAFTPAEAELRAIELLSDDVQFRVVGLNTEDDPVRFVAEEVNEIESFDGLQWPRHGLALYEEGPTDDQVD